MFVLSNAKAHALSLLASFQVVLVFLTKSPAFYTLNKENTREAVLTRTKSSRFALHPM